MNLIDKLLQKDRKDFTAKKTGTYESERLKRLCGDGTVKIQSVPPRRAKEIIAFAMKDDGRIDFKKSFDGDLMMIVEGVVEPDLRDKKLKEHFECYTAQELAELLFGGESDSIAQAIIDLSTEKTETTEDDVKN